MHVITIEEARQRLEGLLEIKEEGKHVAIVTLPGTGRRPINRWLLTNCNFLRVIPDTTRNPEKGEKRVREYHFRSLFHFIHNASTIDGTDYIVGQHYYGINLRELKYRLQDNKRLLFSVSSSGAKALKKIFGESLLVIYVKVSEEIWLQRLESKFRTIPSPRKKLYDRRVFGLLEEKILETEEFVGTEDTSGIIDKVIWFQKDERKPGVKETFKNLYESDPAHIAEIIDGLSKEVTLAVR